MVAVGVSYGCPVKPGNSQSLEIGPHDPGAAIKSRCRRPEIDHNLFPAGQRQVDGIPLPHIQHGHPQLLGGP